MSFSPNLRLGFELRSFRPGDPGRAHARAGLPLRFLAAGAVGPSVALLLLLTPGPLAAQSEASVAGSAAIAAPPATDSNVSSARKAPSAAAEAGTGASGGSTAGRTAAAPGPPRDLEDLNGWLDYKSRAHVLALPLEARLFYRRGVLAREEGKRDEGERWVRAAAELDPSFVEPHLTIAAWSLPGRPSQAMLQWAMVIELARESFLLQAGIAANALFLAFQSLLIALLLAGMILVALHVPELTHSWRERLGGILRVETARWWVLAFVVLPYLAGIGAVLPTLLFLGLLWPVLRVRERSLFVLLAATVLVLPWAAAALERLAAPLDADRAPFHGVALLENEPWSSAQQQRLATLVAREPQNPFVQFGLAWIARRGGDLATAEREYRHALERWPDDDRVLNNLGNVLAMQGRQNEALDLFARAVAARPTNPAPHFNSSQIYTQRFEFKPATEALSRASALDFDLVRDYQSRGTSDGKLPLVDQWISPRAFWLALGATPGLAARATSLPPSWRGHFETTDWRFGPVAAVAGLIGIAFGMVGHRAVPLRACSNCGCVVCRRCAQRRREVALCRDCAKLESRAQSRDFAHVLMNRSRRRAERLQHALRTAVAAIVPGFGLLALRRAVTPVLLLAASALLATPWVGAPLPFELEPRLAAAALPPLPVWIGLVAVIYAWSIGGYLACVARSRTQAAEQAAPELVRPAQATGREPARAA